MKWLSNVFKESLEQILKETKVNLGSVLRRRVSPKQPSKYFIISSSSFSVSLPSLGKSPMSPCAIHQICPQPEEWKRFPLPHIFHCIFPLWYWRYVGLRFLPHWRLVQQVVVEGQHLGPEGEQDISRAVIAAREKPRRLFPRTQGCLKCSCKENEMVDKK